MRRFGKKTLIFGIAALGFLFVGTAYAAKNTPALSQATGEVEVVFGASGTYLYGTGSKGQSVRDIYGGDLNVPKNKTVQSAEGNTLSIDLNGMYPGFSKGYHTSIKNKGKMNASLNSVKISQDVNGSLDNLLGVALVIQEGASSKPAFSLEEGFENSDIFKLDGVTYVRLSALNDKAISSLLDNKKVLLQAGKDSELEAFISFGMDLDREGLYTTGKVEAITQSDDSTSQSKSAKLSLTMDWEQAR